MKLKIKNSFLKDALSKSLSAVDKKGSRPILLNVLFEADKNGLSISTTDLEISVKILIPSNVEIPGKFCINAKNFFEIIKEMPDKEINLEVREQENLLILNCEKINFSLLLVDPSEFPQLSFNHEEEIFVKSTELLKLISLTYHAISNDETRLFLNGIFLQGLGDSIRGVAIDGSRLALYDIKGCPNNSQSLQNGIIIPKKGINELKKISETYPHSNLKIGISETALSVVAEDSYFVSIRLIAREYPKYNSVIPSKIFYNITLKREDLLNSVRRIRILSSEKINGVRLAFKKNELIVSANHPSLGDATEAISISNSNQNEDIEIGFNAKYLIDLLTVIDDENVILGINNEVSPSLIRPGNCDNFFGIIMPLKL